MASGDGLVEVLVEYEYTAEQDDELSLKPGDIVTEVVKLDGGWWEGSLGGKRGVFPDNFVKEITKKRPVEKKKAPKSTPPPSSGKDVTKDAKRSRRAKATYSYVAENPDELSLKPGDIVEVVNQEEEGWWEGIVDGKRGVFPSNFVQFTDDATKGEENDFKEIKGKKIKGVGFGDIFAGGVPKLKPKKQGSTDSEISSPPIVNNQSNHRVIPEVQHSNVSISPKIKESPPSKPVERARVLYPYNAENEDELSLEDGDIVIILEKELEDSGWWKGSLRGKVGVFPDNFVELLPEEKPQRPGPPITAKLRPIDSDRGEEKNKSHNIHKKPNPAPPVREKPEYTETTSDVSGKLKHPTKDRPKPPSLRNPAKPAATKEQPHRNIPPQHNSLDADNISTSPRDHVSPIVEKKVANAKPNAVPSSEIAELRKELSEMKTNTVSKQKYDELMDETNKLKAQLEEMNAKFEKKLFDIMMEVDEEKKLRMTSQIEVERIKKLLAPKT